MVIVVFEVDVFVKFRSSGVLGGGVAISLDTGLLVKFPTFMAVTFIIWELHQLRSSRLAFI